MGLLQASVTAERDLSSIAPRNPETFRGGIFQFWCTEKVACLCGRSGSDSFGTSGFIVGHRRLPSSERAVLAHSDEIRRTKALSHYFLCFHHLKTNPNPGSTLVIGKKPTLLAPRGLSCRAWRLLVTAGGADRRGLRTPLSQTREKKNIMIIPGGSGSRTGRTGPPPKLPRPGLRRGVPQPGKRWPEARPAGPRLGSAERDPLGLQPPRGR